MDKEQKEKAKEQWLEKLRTRDTYELLPIPRVYGWPDHWEAKPLPTQSFLDGIPLDKKEEEGEGIMDKGPNEDGHLEFHVEDIDEIHAIIKQYGAEGEEFQGGDESPRHICHVKSPHGLLYFYAPTAQMARDIWEYWFPEHREAREGQEAEQEGF